jgi:hypothetical protein
MYGDGSTDQNMAGYVVCKPCPDHGRRGKDFDFSSSPVIGRYDEHYVYIVQEGASSE